MGEESASSARGRPDAADDQAWALRLVAALPDLWFRLSADQRFLASGGPQEDLYVPAASFLGQRVEDVLPAVAAEPLARAITSAATGERVRVEYALPIAGVERFFVAIVCPVGLGEVVMFVREVTARVSAERRVADSERRFRAVVEVANEGVWMLDADGLTSFVTDRMAAMLGYRVEEMIGAAPEALVAQSSREELRARIERRRAGITESGPVELVSKDGSVVPTSVSATPIRDAEGRYLGSVAMVTDEREASSQASELAETQRRLGAIAEAHDDVFYVGEVLADGSYHELFVGSGTDRLLGGPVPDGVEVGDAWSAAVHPDHRAAYDAMNHAIATGRTVQLEYLVVGFDGVARWMHDRARPRPVSEDGRHVFDGVLSDVTARREQSEALLTALAELNSAHASLEEAHIEADRLARTDALTGVANRRAFTEAIARECARADRSGQRVAVVMLDVDHFKRVNDSYGHDVGDEVLREVATRVKAAVRTYDVVARWGGEEFVVLFSDVPDDRGLRRVAEAVTVAIRATPIATTSGPLRVTASAGAALRAPWVVPPDAVIDAADQGLYAAKRRGRNRVVLESEVTTRDTTPEEPEAIRLAEGLAIAASIREAIPPLHCSQVADLAAETAAHLVCGSEVVMRARLGGWLHDLGKLAIPDEILRGASAGTLDSAEQQTLRRHAEIGAAIISGMPSLAEAAPAVRHHHERFDGSGYPSGLKGEQIPLEARIVAAADAYSAITAGRAYQAALDHQSAISALRTAEGTSLDPSVVAAMIAVLEERDERPAAP